MYNQTVVRGIAEQHFTVPELMQATGIRSDKTVRQALKGLEAKLSIKTVNAHRSSHFGPRIRVFQPKEITDRRKKAKLIIDPKTKRILSQVESAAARAVDSEGDSPVISSVRSSADSSVTSSVYSSVPSLGENYRSERQNLPHIYKHDNKDANSASHPSSSVPTQRDDEKFSSVKQLFQELSGGGNWKDERDLKTYQEIEHIDLYNIIIGLSYSVARSPEHRMSSLAYAVPAILEHYQQMKLFPADDLAKIAYETMRKTMLCLRTGKWTIPEWLSGSES